MSKYDPLGRFLKSETRDYVPMTFAEIERLLNIGLPNSKLHRAWWSNNPTNNVMTRQWLDAGYETEQVDVEAGKVVFRRAAKHPASSSGSRSSIFGCLKGMVKLAPGTDLTAPTGEDWQSNFSSGFHEAGHKS
ncbi:MAG: hypothetical protein GYA66_15205 [Phyllobacteriaceae bacterium]|nr:hypothetical protein [Phyllobacteriaceae bacterium]